MLAGVVVVLLGVSAAHAEPTKEERAAEIAYETAETYRVAKRFDDAVVFYERYLQLSPTAKDRMEVEETIAELRAAARVQQPAPPQIVRVITVNPEPEKIPVYKKAWFWTVLGAGTTAIAVGIGLGVGLSERHSPAMISFSTPASTISR
jgi:hypothetical protein